MVRRVAGLLIVAVLIALPARALGLGADYGKEELKSRGSVGGPS